MATTWIMIADSTRARLLAREDKEPALQEIADFVCPEGRAKGREAPTDRRASVSVAHGRLGHAGHTIEPRTGDREKAAAAFARELGAALERGRIEGCYGALVLMAPPRFLGALRDALNPHLHALVTGDVDKDLIGADTRTILSHLPE
jgi:protein required for attachment to host cells